MCTKGFDEESTRKEQFGRPRPDGRVILKRFLNDSVGTV
jgi:hypothetical protein